MKVCERSAWTKWKICSTTILNKNKSKEKEWNVPARRSLKCLRVSLMGRPPVHSLLQRPRVAPAPASLARGRLLLRWLVFKSLNATHRLPRVVAPIRWLMERVPASWACSDCIQGKLLVPGPKSRACMSCVAQAAAPRRPISSAWARMAAWQQLAGWGPHPNKAPPDLLTTWNYCKTHKTQSMPNKFLKGRAQVNDRCIINNSSVLLLR